MKFRSLRRGSAAARSVGVRRLRMESLESRQLLSANARLVGDLNALPAFIGSEPLELTTTGDSLFFTADDGVHGIELWISDGTATGTHLLKDFRVGGGSGRPSELTNVNGTLFFTAEVAGSGRELWKSDGTFAGTLLVKDFAPQIPDMDLNASLTNVNGLLLFFASDSDGNNLWRTDGTPEGTFKLTSIAPYSFYPVELTTVGDAIYFPVYKSSDATGHEIWKSDGTIGGTFRVKSFQPGPHEFGPAFPMELTNVNGTLFFVANDDVSGYELWKSDGTEAGTVLVRDIVPGAEPVSEFAGPRGLTNYNGSLLFTVSDGVLNSALWKSNGTETGTVPLRDSDGQQIFADLSSSAVLDGALIFTAYDAATGDAVWRTDGTEAGTFSVRDIREGDEPSRQKYFTESGGEVYFTANDGVHGEELWKTDGTTAGTLLVKDIHESFIGSQPSGFTRLNGATYFIANGPGGRELWRTDGAEEGTTLVVDLRPATGGSYPTFIGGASGRLYFTASSGFIASSGEIERRFWMSDGSSISEVASSTLDVFRSGANVNGSFYFGARQADTGYELWRTGGTTAGSQLVQDINPTGNSYPDYLTNVNGKLFFFALDGTTGRELWTFDGGITSLVKDIRPGSFGSTSGPIVAVGDVLYFVANDGTSGSELWRSDGTAAGTQMVADVRPGAIGSSVTNLVSVGTTIYFRANDGTSGDELWKSDGTTAGTLRVKDIRSGLTSTDVANLTNVDGVLYFTATTPGNGRELWKSNGSEAGTIVALESPGAAQYAPRYLTNVAGNLYFIDGGNDLWKVPKVGAASKLGDFSWGINAASPMSLTSVGTTLYFAAERYAGTGLELWRSDGTLAGTKAVIDTYVYAGSNPRNLMNVDGRLYFSAHDGVHGQELWFVPSDADTAARGDFDQNDVVDGADFLKWQRGFGSANPTSDGDGDGAVGGGDLGVWREHFGLPESAAQQNGTAAAALVADEEDAADAEFAAASLSGAMDDAAEPGQRARDALFAAGDFSRLFGLGGDGKFENLMWRRGRAPLARRG